jgi:hypothetical protein
MINKKVLHVVHCIDTEGPLNETLEATFSRLESIFNIKLDATEENLELIQNKKLDLQGKEDEVAKCFSKDLLNYNKDWADIDGMLSEALSTKFRTKILDDFNGSWVYSWHCMDHVGYTDNPRFKELGYGKIFNYYQEKLAVTSSEHDEINWHFHPLSLTRNPLNAATNYLNSYDVLLQILCRRIIDKHWFPVVNRPGFHSERPDSHAFLEQWIPFDYANQRYSALTEQPDLGNGRFGDWRRSTTSWRGYNPSHDDYQVSGQCRRKIFRCLNVGTRFNELTIDHVREAFLEASEQGNSILAFADHDYRDIRQDVDFVRELLQLVKLEYPDVQIKFSGAEAAARAISDSENYDPPILSLRVEVNVIKVNLESGDIFGPQPFLALKSNNNSYYHDNFDEVIPGKKWRYILDEQTIRADQLSEVGVATAGKYGHFDVQTYSMKLQSNK